MSAPFEAHDQVEISDPLVVIEETHTEAELREEFNDLSEADFH